MAGTSFHNLLLVGLLFVLFMAPFDEGAGRDLVPLTALAVASIALATAFLRRRLELSSLDRTRRSPALLPLLVFLAVAAASVVWSIDRFVSLTGLVRLFACTMVFALVLYEFRDARHARLLCAAVVVLAALLSPLGIWQALTAHGQHIYSSGARAHSVFVTPNTFAALLIITLPMAISLAVTADHVAVRLAFWLVAAMLTFALVLSRSYGAWLAGAAGLSFLGWELARLKLKRPKQRLRLTVAAALAVLILPTVFLALSRQPGLRSSLLSSLPAQKRATAEERFIYTDSTLAMAAQALPLGIGLDTYHLDYPAHRHATLAGSDQWFAHNDYLQVLVELGPLGLAALLWLLWRMARMADQVLQHTSDADQTALVAGCCAGAGAALLHSLVDYNLYVPATALGIFLCFGIIAAAHSRLARYKAASAGRSPTGATVRRLLSRLVLAAGTVAVLFAVRPLVAWRLLKASNFNAPYATAVNPLSAYHWSARGHMQSLVDSAAAATSYRRAIHLSPRDARHYASLGSLLQKSSHSTPDAAEKNPGLGYLRRACALDRYSARCRWLLGKAYVEAGRIDDGMRQLEFCLDRCRPDPDLRKALRRLLARLRGPKG